MRLCHKCAAPRASASSSVVAQKRHFKTPLCLAVYHMLIKHTVALHLESIVLGTCQCDQLWQNFKSFRPLFECLYSIWRKVKPTLANLFGYWVNFQCCKWPNIEHIIQSSGHTGTYADTYVIVIYFKFSKYFSQCTLPSLSSI